MSYGNQNQKIEENFHFKNKNNNHQKIFSHEKILQKIEFHVKENLKGM